MSEAIEPSNGQQDERGRFVRGNKLGKGNPLAGRVARIRAAYLKALTPADAEAIAEQLILQAKGGDIAAAREVMDRCIGKAIQPIDTSGQTGCSKIVFQVLAPDFNGDAAGSD